MADQFVTDKANEAAKVLWEGISVGIACGQDPKETFVFCVSAYMERQFERIGELVVENQKLLDTVARHQEYK